jgi:anti-anti-sigma regulatory factor
MTAQVVLPARLDSAAAAELAQALRAHEGAEVALDAAGVDLMGAKALQTLLVAAAAWRDAGHGFAVTGLTEKVRGQLAMLGLADLSLIEGDAP